MGIFDALDQVEVFENSQYFQQGMYVVEIQKCLFKENGHKGDSFIVEARVLGLESDHEEAPGVGALAAQVWNTSNGKEKLAKSTWMGFLCAVTGKKQGDLSAAQWARVSKNAVGDGQGLAGRKMLLDVFTKPQKNDPNKVFTHHKWLREATEEDLAQYGVE